MSRCLPPPSFATASTRSNPNNVIREQTAKIPRRMDVSLFLRSDGHAQSFNREPLRARLSFSQSRNQPRGKPIGVLRSAESFPERNYRRRFLRSGSGIRSCTRGDGCLQTAALCETVLSENRLERRKSRERPTRRLAEHDNSRQSTRVRCFGANKPFCSRFIRPWRGAT